MRTVSQAVGAVAAIGLYLAISADAQAQTPRRTSVDADLKRMLGTQSVSTEANLSDSKVPTCAITFRVLTRDTRSRQGGYSIVTGSFGFANAQGKLATMLKVEVEDLNIQAMTATPNTPKQAYFVSGSSTTKSAVLGTNPSDAPGSIFVVLKFAATFPVIVEALKTNKIKIAVTRGGKSPDIQFEVDTTVTDTTDDGRRTYSTQPNREFLDCASSLMEQVMTKRSI